jgi:hypothetical protein
MPEAPRSAESADTPPVNTELGPICPECLSAGGETSDFDGGKPLTCAIFQLTAPASDAEVELAGFDVAAYRSQLERSFETSLRWTDLTASSAQPWSTPIAGYLPETVVRGSVVTGSLQKTFLDAARCPDAAQCTVNAYNVLDCSDRAAPSYTIAAEVTLATDDGAIHQVFPGAVLLRANGPEPATNASSPGPDAALSIVSHVDVANVRGTLRVEPLPEVAFGWLTLVLRYFPDNVRGQLTLNLDNDWQRQIGTGSDLQPIEDRPLVANFPIDDCEAHVPPAPLDEPDPQLSDRTPADELAALGSIVNATDATASWSHTGQQTRLLVEVDTPAYACVTEGRINNVPLRLSTTDGLLDWSVLATHERADESAGLPHRLSFYQELTPHSKMWNEVFGAFPLEPNTERVFVRFRGEYPAAGTQVPLSGEPGHAVLEISESASCASHIFVCDEEQSACLVTPPGAECFVRP